MEYKLISGKDLEDNLDKYFIIDVRTKEEYAAGHVPGSINVPHEEVLEHIDKINTDKPLAIYCGSTRRSKYVADILTYAGFDDITIAPGVRLYNYKMTK